MIRLVMVPLFHTHLLYDGIVGRPFNHPCVKSIHALCARWGHFSLFILKNKCNFLLIYTNLYHHCSTKATYFCLPKYINLDNMYQIQTCSSFVLMVTLYQHISVKDTYIHIFPQY